MLWKTAGLFVAALVLVGFTVLASAGEGKDKAVAKDKKALQGAWAAEKDGKKVQMVITGDKFVLSAEGKKMGSGTFTIDPTQKPKTIDLLVTEGDNANFVGKTSRAIYEVDAGKFKWCANEPGKDERPKEFVDKAGDSRFLLINFEREKK